MKQKSHFKTINGYNGDYQISPTGIVKSFKGVSERILKTRLSTTGYLVVSLSHKCNVKVFKVHQLVAITFLNHNPDGTHRIVVDHINNNPLDNRMENLQLISQRENASKDKKGKTSKFTGVCWHKGSKRWRATISINGKGKHLGSFTNELDASNSYNKELNNLTQ